MGEKKKKNDPSMRTLTTATGTRIPIPLTDEEERQQLQWTHQQSTVERKATNIFYLKGAGPSGLELQRKALENAAKRKATMETAKARGEGASSHGGVPFEGEQTEQGLKKGQRKPPLQPNQGGIQK